MSNDLSRRIFIKLAAALAGTATVPAMAEPSPFPAAVKPVSQQTGTMLEVLLDGQWAVVGEVMDARLELDRQRIDQPHGLPPRYGAQTTTFKVDLFPKLTRSHPVYDIFAAQRRHTIRIVSPTNVFTLDRALQVELNTHFGQSFYEQWTFLSDKRAILTRATGA